MSQPVVPLNGIEITIAFLFIVVIAILLVRNRHLRTEKINLERRVVVAESREKSAFQQMASVFRISQLFAESRDENEVVDLVLQLSQELVGARGASFVAFDERGNVLPAIRYGELPVQVSNDWLEYLASPLIRQRCASCQKREEMNLVCPLLTGTLINDVGIYCVPLRRGDKEFGVLNLYLPKEQSVPSNLQSIIRTIVDEATLALEGVRLRKREFESLQQIQIAREKSDAKSLIIALLENIKNSLKADFVLVALWGKSGDLLENLITPENSSPEMISILDKNLNRLRSSSEPILLEQGTNVSKSTDEIHTLIAIPILDEAGSSFGSLLVANSNSRPFHPRQIKVLQTIAMQIALVARSVNVMAELEYKTMIAERTRLAREIHDGLAQTLGFLKLRLGQMKNYLDQGEIERLGDILPGCYDSVAEAYEDARHAIDDLRISECAQGFSSWLIQVLEDFQESGDIHFHLRQPLEEPEFPPEVRVQLVRIVQEALNNIRKHARATNVWCSSRVKNQEFLLVLEDDGIGFNPNDVSQYSQHGLRGMRERAELIGGDFQVTSLPHKGTVISLRIPFGAGERVR